MAVGVLSGNCCQGHCLLLLLCWFSWLNPQLALSILNRLDPPSIGYLYPQLAIWILTTIMAAPDSQQLSGWYQVEPPCVYIILEMCETDLQSHLHAQADVRSIPSLLVTRLSILCLMRRSRFFIGINSTSMVVWLHLCWCL